MHWFSDPKAATVFSPRGIACTFAGLEGGRPVPPPSPCASVRQTHSTLVHEALGAEVPLPEGDGVFTRQRQLWVGVQTADCLPVLLACPEGKFLAALHAGWRGLTAGMIQVALEKAALYTDSRKLLAVTGPCISARRFEVGPEVAEAVLTGPLALSPSVAALGLYRGQGDRWHVDLSVLAVLSLLQAGLEPRQISALRSCTYEHPELWTSYRRTGSARPSIWTCASYL